MHIRKTITNLFVQIVYVTWWSATQVLSVTFTSTRGGKQNMNHVTIVFQMLFIQIEKYMWVLLYIVQFKAFVTS